MKTLINYLTTLLTPFETQKEQISGLIPVRVVTKVRPDHPYYR
jgi:anthranilate phosphoribosyltransferase